MRPVVAIPWPVIGGIVGASLGMVGIGVGVLRMTPPDFRAGRGWFWAATLWMMVSSAAAYLATDRSVGGACILGAVEIAVLVLLIVGLRWIGARERRHTQVASQGIHERRARVVPELAYEGSPSHRTANVYCRNIGQSWAREVSLRITGNTLRPLTFKIIQRLAPDGAVVPARPLYEGAYEPSILGTLSELSFAKIAVTKTDEPVEWLLGQPPPFPHDIVLILNYVDEQTESAVSDVWVFESILPANNVMGDHQWILRPRPAPPA